jgi:hypothetical protein
MNDINNDIFGIGFNNDTNNEDIADIQTFNNGNKNKIEEAQQNIE